MNIIICLIHQQVINLDSRTSLIKVNSLLLRTRSTTKHETQEKKVDEDNQKKTSMRIRKKDFRVPSSFLFYLPIFFILHPLSA